MDANPPPPPPVPEPELSTTVVGTGTVTIPSEHATNDTRTVFAVVLGLILIVLSVIACATVLAFYKHTLPDTLIGLGGVGVGALAGLLASTASKKQQ